MNKMKTSVYLDPDLLTWLKAEADRKHCSMAQLIRSFIVKAREQGSDK